MSKQKAEMASKALWCYLTLDNDIELKVRKICAMAKDCMVRYGKGRGAQMMFEKRYKSKAFEAAAVIKSAVNVSAIIRSASEWTEEKVEQRGAKDKSVAAEKPTVSLFEYVAGSTKGKATKGAENLLEVETSFAPRMQRKVAEPVIDAKPKDNELEVVAFEEPEVMVEGSDETGGPWAWL